MSEQILYSIKQAAIMGGLAVGAYVLTNQDAFFGNLDSTAKVFAVGLVTLGVRVFEGWRDGVRANKGKLQDSDVGTSVIENTVQEELAVRLSNQKLLDRGIY